MTRPDQTDDQTMEEARLLSANLAALGDALMESRDKQNSIEVVRNNKGEYAFHVKLYFDLTETPQTIAAQRAIHDSLAEKFLPPAPDLAGQLAASLDQAKAAREAK